MIGTNKKLTLQVSLITWIYIVTGIISLQLVFTVWKHQKIRGKWAFICMMALSSYWSFLLSFESAVPTIELKVALSQYEYFANMFIPPLFFLFIFSSDLDNISFFKRYFIYLWVVPVLTIILVFTNDFHHLIWTGFSWSKAGFNILNYHHGPVFYLAMAYSLGVIFLANFVLIRFILSRTGYYKSRAVFLLSGSLVALLTGLVYTLGLSPMEGLDISPMGTMIAGIIFFLGIFREQLFDIVPFSQQFMIEKLKDGVIVLDSRNFIVDISPVATKILKIERNVTGQRIESVLPVLKKVFEDISMDEESRREIAIEAPMDWFEITRYPLKGPKATLLGSLLIIHDIGHRKRGEMQLRKLAEELTDLNHMKDRIYSIISHDLRNPFNSILGYSQLLAESYDEYTVAERQQFAVHIFNSSRGVFNLLENLLEWSTSQLGKFTYSPEDLILKKSADETLALMRLMATNKRIELVNMISSSQAVFADRNMLAAILRNLVSNAIKFTAVGGKVELSCSATDDMVEVTVSDNGIGMTTETITGLFNHNSLNSNPGTANEKGTGLGLLLSKDFIIKHNGSIRVTSEPGKGSRFTFTLPVKSPRYPLNSKDHPHF